MNWMQRNGIQKGKSAVLIYTVQKSQYSRNVDR